MACSKCFVLNGVGKLTCSASKSPSTGTQIQVPAEAPSPECRRHRRGILLLSLSTRIGLSCLIFRGGAGRTRRRAGVTHYRLCRGGVQKRSAQSDSAPKTKGDDRAKQNFANTVRLIAVRYRATAVAFDRAPPVPRDADDPAGPDRQVRGLQKPGHPEGDRISGAVRSDHAAQAAGREGTPPRHGNSSG